MTEKILWNTGWKFSKTDLSVSYEQEECRQRDAAPVSLPHDWLIENPLDLYADGIGWYQKSFSLAEKEANTKYYLSFDGIYMDSALYVNDREIGQWKYGYSPVLYEITDALHAGENTVVVRVVHRSPNSRWYSGAGIFRDVYFLKRPTEQILPDGIYLHTEKQGEDFCLRVSAELSKACFAADFLHTKHPSLRVSVRDEEDILTQTELSLEELSTDTLETAPEMQTPDGRVLEAGFLVETELTVHKPRLWDVDDPKCYAVTVELLGKEREEPLQTECLRTGFCTKEFTPQEGFLLNGRKLRLNGVCEHHDLGALGAAFSKEAMRRKFRILREMGVNALRTSHNMPAKEVLDLADEMGLLVVAEAFDMWELPKTDYDYSRFFKEWSAVDIRSFVRRDRSHVCLLMWSIGNEIYDTHAGEHGREIAIRLRDEVYRHDPYRNARVTIGSNYMAWEGAQNCARTNGLAGYNYGEVLYREHHEKHPDWVIYGSETASVVKSRGIYHFPFRQSILSDEDEQCSSLGNSYTSWGAKGEEYCITMDRDTPFSCGQFLWTGFDYIGEPTPYHTKNSYFGMVDTAGFPKDAYYIYRAAWTDYRKKPFVHIFPYWDFNEGQEVDIRVCSNAPRVQIYVNDELLGDKKIDQAKDRELLLTVQTKYRPGKIVGVALDENGHVLCRQERVTPKEAAALVLTTQKQVLSADGEDLTYVEISAVDADGNPVDNAAMYVEVLTEGAGRLVGLDNGDSTDYDSYKGTIRKLFSGKLSAIISATDQSGEIRVTARDARESVYLGTLPVTEGQPAAKAEMVTEGKTAENAAAKMQESAAKAEMITKEQAQDKKLCPVKSGSITLHAIPAKMREGVALRTANSFTPLAYVPVGFVPIRKIALKSDSPFEMTEERPSIQVEAEIFPKDADGELIFKAVNAYGIESNLVTVEADGSRAVLTAQGDGECYIRCMTKNGTDKVKLISQIECRVTGMGQATLNPYEFVCGGLFTDSSDGILSGLQNSFSTARRKESWAGFSNLEFGDYGSDEVMLSIFANSNDPQPIRIYEGIPGEEGSTLIYEGAYHRPSTWQVFKPQTFTLNKRLRGKTTISILTEDGMYVGGFCFTKKNPARERNLIGENPRIYGDLFERCGDKVEKIGNNVSVEYEAFDFGEEGIRSVTICGRTSLANNTIHIRFSDEEGSCNQIVEFPMEKEYTEHTFSLEKICGIKKVSFLFLPGSNFDFHWFRFS